MQAVLTLDPSGRPSRWSSWEEAICYIVKGLVTWHYGDETVYHGGTRMTGENSTIAVPNIISVKNEVFDGRVALNNGNLFARDLNMCCYCGSRLPRHQLTREHIIPVSRGGENAWTNCATCCKKCNNFKGAKLPHEAGMSLLYVPYVPTKAEALIMAGRNIQGDQMELLQQFLPKHSRLLVAS